MKKIIDGKMYNTETAKELGYYQRNSCTFSRICEILYKTKKGNYFLDGCGGPQSKYAVYDGNEVCGGEDIIPLSEEAARKWAEQYLEADVYVEEFGEVEEA